MLCNKYRLKKNSHKFEFKFSHEVSILTVPKTGLIGIINKNEYSVKDINEDRKEMVEILLSEFEIRSGNGFHIQVNERSQG